MAFIDSLEPRRLFAAGALDPSFGGDGSVDVQINVHAYRPTRTDADVDDQGRSLVGGYYSTRKQISLTRLKADGTVDAAFGKNGIATITLAAADAKSGSFKLVADHAGRVLLLLDKSVVRLGANGRIDAKFGAKGRLALPVLADAADVAVDARNNLLIVGTAAGKTGGRATIVRLGTKRGALDTSFGSGGAYKTPVPQDPSFKDPGDAGGLSLRVLDDGDIVGVASIDYVYADYPGNFNPLIRNGISTFRLDTNGALDPSYGNAGSFAVTRDANDVTSASVTLEAILPDGGVITENDVASSDDPEPQPGDGEHSYSYVDAGGKLKVAKFDIVPSALAPQPSASADRGVVGVQDDGRLLVLVTGGASYRLTREFALDTSFTPAIGFRSASIGGEVIQSGTRLLSFGGTKGLGSTFSVTAMLA